MTTINTIPAKVPTTIYQGTPWPGVQVRFVDTAGDVQPLDEVSGRVATAESADGGVWLADCDVAAADADGYVAVTLTGVATALLPRRQVFIDIWAKRVTDAESSVVMRIRADVEGALPTEPEAP